MKNSSSLSRPGTGLLHAGTALLIAASLFASVAFGQAPAVLAAPAIDNSVLQKASVLAFQREVARLRKERKIDPESTALAYTRRLVAPMVAQAAKPPFLALEWSWQAAVETSSELGFWCLPGGNLVITSAFFEGGRFSAAELAALIAHGYAHQLAGHDAAEAAALVAAHPDGASADPNRRLLVLADILTKMVQRAPYERGHEREADSIALELLARSGHDPRGLLMLWRKLAVAGLSPTAGLAYVHPGWPERSAEIEAQLPAATALYERTKAEQSKPAPRPRRIPR